MFPCFATSMNPRCLGPCLCAVCVKVAATFLRAGCSISSDSNFFNNGLFADLSPSMNFLTASLTCTTSADVGRGMATSGGTGAGGPITTTGATPPRPGPCVVAGGTLVCGALCASASPAHVMLARPVIRMRTKRFMLLSFRDAVALECSSISNPAVAAVERQPEGLL